jgi:hypothetical protein
MPAIVAARSGVVQLFEYVQGSRTVPLLDVAIMNAAAQRGKSECVQWLCDSGCTFDAETAVHAAGGGHVLCLQYLHEAGCAWDSGTTTAASRGGHLHCLQYAHENGCAWDEHTTSAAAEHGHSKCLDYALSAECPWSATQAKMLVLIGATFSGDVLLVFNKHGVAVPKRAGLSMPSIVELMLG